MGGRSGSGRGEEISTRETRDNVEGNSDMMARVCHELAGQGRLRRSKQGNQRVLWSLVAGKEELLKNRFPHCPTSFQTEGKRGTGLSVINADSYADDEKAVPARFPTLLEPGTGTGFFDGKRTGKRDRRSGNSSD